MPPITSAINPDPGRALNISSLNLETAVLNPKTGFSNRRLHIQSLINPEKFSEASGARDTLPPMTRLASFGGGHPSKKYRTGISISIRNHIYHPVHPVRKVYIPMPRLTEHYIIPFGFSA